MASTINLTDIDTITTPDALRTLARQIEAVAKYADLTAQYRHAATFGASEAQVSDALNAIGDHRRHSALPSSGEITF